MLTVTFHPTLVGRCTRGCGRFFRATLESIEESREDFPGLADSEIVASWDFCRSCVDGVEIPGEYDTRASHPAADLSARLAVRFAALVRAELSAEALHTVVARNKTAKYAGACATQDFCDANVLMGLAFAEVVGRDADPASDEDAVLWDSAWDYARESEFRLGDAPLTPFLVTFRVGQRSMRWTRFAVSAEAARASAEAILSDEFPRAKILSVVPEPED